MGTYELYKDKEGRGQSIRRHPLDIYSRIDQRHFLQFRLEIANFLRTFNHVGIFDQAFYSPLLPLSPSLWFAPAPPPLPLPCVKLRSTLYSV
jgi:hypothetical protein